MPKFAVGDLQDRLLAWFPEREFFMRSRGQVRFIRISSRLQLIAAAGVATLALVWAGTLATVTVSHFLSARERAQLLARETVVANAEKDVSTYRRDLGKVAQDLDKRQDFLEQMVRALPADAKLEAADAARTATTAAPGKDAARKVSANLPEAAGLAKVAERQIAFAEALTRLVERRAASAEARIRALGMNPAVMLASIESRAGRGGPLVRLATGTDGSVDPRFARLGVGLARMDALERGLAGIPQVDPASREYISSGFGYRADPFTGEGAFHAGLDFRGPLGAPIYAASAGTVAFVGQRSGYGNVVEIDHGNGLMTRYAHMSAFNAVPGAAVRAGQVIGAIGNSGRSTGPHLHFEVRLNDQALNPLPFLEAAARVQQNPASRPRKQ